VRVRAVSAPSRRRQSSVELERLWSLVAIEAAVRSHRLQSRALTSVGETLGLSRAALEELFETRRRSLQISFADALTVAAADVARRYRRAGRTGSSEWLRDRFRAILDPRDEDTLGSCARCTLLPAPLADVRLSVWELPRPGDERLSGHHLEGRHVLVVLEGRPALRAGAQIRDLQRDQVAVVPSTGGDLLNKSARRVRVLVLQPVSG
jgi:hypothetical protein